MLDYIIIELPFVSAAGMPYPDDAGALQRPEGVDQYWRIRWIAFGREIDQDCWIDDLEDMARMARSCGQQVVWRYYPTGLEA